MSLVYEAVPEKYFTPVSEEVVQEIKLSSFIWGGAPQFGGKLMSHGPCSVVNSVLTGCGSIRDGAVAVWRNTTKTDPSGSRCNGTTVRPFSTLYSACSISPVSGCQSSA